MVGSHSGLPHVLVGHWERHRLLEAGPQQRQSQLLPLLVRVLDSVKVGHVLELWHDHFLAGSQSPVVQVLFDVVTQDICIP